MVAARNLPAAGGAQGGHSGAMLRNTVRGILGLVFAAGATWLANYVVEKVFGPEESETTKAQS